MKYPTIQFHPHGRPLDALLHDIAAASKSCAQAIANAVTTVLVEPAEPHIHQRRSAHGYAYWQVFDPRTHQTLTFDTEQEVRAWLETRYNH